MDKAETLKSWLTGKTILTAEQVRKLEPGSQVWMHQCFGRQGEHIYVKATVVKSGKSKKLKMYDWRGLAVFKDIVKKDNIAYTED